MSMHVTVRVFWSMLWRTVLIGIVIGRVLAFFMPPSPIAAMVLERSRADLAPYFSAYAPQELSYADAYQTATHHLQRAVREQGLLSGAYAHVLLQGIVPAMLASFIAASIVLGKRYALFQMTVTDTSQVPRRTVWWPAAAFTGIVYAPFFAMSALYYASPYSAVFTSWIVSYALYHLAGIILFAALVHVALRYPYKTFHLKSEPVAVMKDVV